MASKHCTRTPDHLCSCFELMMKARGVHVRAVWRWRVPRRWISGWLDFWGAGFPGRWISGALDFQGAGFPGRWNSEASRCRRSTHHLMASEHCTRTPDHQCSCCPMKVKERSGYVRSLQLASFQALNFRGAGIPGRWISTALDFRGAGFSRRWISEALEFQSVGSW